MSKIILSEDQEVAYETIVKWLSDGGIVHHKQKNPKLLSLGGYAGTGKAVNIDEILPTPEGYKTVKDINVGDFVFDNYGNPTKVIKITNIFFNRKCYKVEFSDKSSVIVDSEHLWETLTIENKTIRRLPEKKPWQTSINSQISPTVKTTEEILHTLLDNKKRFNHYIENCKPLNLSPKNYEISPYLLGVWLGDGTSIRGEITSADPEIFSYINEEFQADQPQAAKKRKCTKYSYLVLNLTNRLKLLGLINNKHIPIEYLRGSIEQRKDLLCGLMDTDGTVDKHGNVSFSSSNKILINQTIELIRSLGLTCKYKGIKLNGKISYTIYFTANFPVFKLKRKLNKQSFFKRLSGRFITKINEIKSVPVKCIGVESENNLFLLSNYIPTHNTTLISTITKEFNRAIRFAFCALSGKAASVLGKKLQDQGIRFEEDGHYCGTIHRLIYRPIENEEGEVIFWAKKETLEYDVIVLDEASMVSEDIFRDLSSYGIDILAIGDHGQLPPIEGRFSLMSEPVLLLEKIHRQAADNPIINLSMQIRERGKIPKGYKNNKHIKIFKKNEYIDLLKEIYKGVQNPELIIDTAVLCYKNTTRTRLNIMIRNLLFGKISSTPLTNDIVMCLRNSINNRKEPLYNGFRGYLISGVTNFDDDFYEGKIRFPYEGFDTNVNNMLKYQFGFNKTFSSFSELEQFGMEIKHWSEVGLLFDYGYAMTVHKMQGSQANNIVLFNERPAPVDDDTYRRWLYTAISRSSNKLTIIT
jgi:hypothetical protein